MTLPGGLHETKSFVVSAARPRIMGFMSYPGFKGGRMPGRSVRSVALFLSLALTGCGGGGEAPGEPVDPAVPPPAAPPPMPPPADPPPMPPPADRAKNGEPSGPSSCPADTIAPHPSLGLGCLARAAFLRNVEAWSEDYRSVPGFANQWGLGAIRADRAYAHLHLLEGDGAAPGDGVVIGFIDTGIDEDHPSLAGADITETFRRGAVDETGNKFSHGTAVASVAAGRRLSGSAAHHGVAWGADIVMTAIPLGEGGDFFIPESLPSLDNADSRNSIMFRTALDQEPDILNLSIGIAGIVEDYSEPDLRANHENTIAALAQVGAREKTVLVWAAGNSHGLKCRTADAGARCIGAGSDGVGTVDASSPLIWSGAAARIAELRGHSVAVIATRRDGTIAEFSNRCGIAADWCIAAPGQETTVANFGPFGGTNGVRTWNTRSGTSFAAPMVSGGLAVMKQLFRGQLSNTELLSRLFITANKTGIYADRSIYGQGLMDLGAATNPWGMTAFMGTGQPVAGGSGGSGAASSAIRPSQALGDSFGHALAGREVAAFDELGAPFWFAADSFVRPLRQSAAAARLDRLFAASGSVRPETGAWRLDVRPGVQAQDSGHLTLAGGADRIELSTPHGWSAAFFHRPQESESPPLAGVAAAWRPAGLPPVTLQAGWLAERDSLLGGSASGAFGRLAGRTAFLSAQLETDRLPGWRLTAGGEWGVVSPDTPGGPLIRNISTLGTEAFRVAARRHLPAGGTLQFAVEQPVRVAGGTAVLDLPTGRTADGHVAGESVRVGLAPTGRQLDLSARLDHPLAGGALAFETVLSRQTGHRADAPATWTVVTGWKKRF